MSVVTAQTLNKSNKHHSQQQKQTQQKNPVDDHRQVLLDETFGNNAQDSLEYKQQPQAVVVATTKTTTGRDHHTFASARHANHPHHPTANTTNADKNDYETQSFENNNKNSQVQYTQDHHVAIQSSFLPYGARGRPNCGTGQRQFIVTCQPNTENECYHELDAAGVMVFKTMKGTNYFVICIQQVDNDDFENVLESIAAMDFVLHIEEDPLRNFASIPNLERKLDRDTVHVDEEQTIPYGLEMMQVLDFWERYPARGEDITVCIVDTGLYVHHEDIPDSPQSNGSSDSDLVNPWYEDGYKHGTHVAGIVAAIDNEFGIVGAAPNVNIFVARVFDNEGTFTASSLIDAMKECYTAGGADIINMSIGGDVSSRAEEAKIDELTDLGVLIVAAAGNFGGDDNVISYPGAYDNSMSVSALDREEHLGTFSCFNSHVTLAGPGVDVLSTSSESPNDYIYMTGTSQASPFATGVAALLMSQFPERSAMEIWDAMVATAKDLGACGTDRVYGAGLIQALDAAMYLEGTLDSDEPHASSSSSACIETQVTIQMPEMAGNMTRYDITLQADRGAVAYRGGMFVPGELYEDTFSLHDNNCYRFEIWDDENAGFQGDGYYEVIYNGVQVAYSDAFSGKGEAVFFGSCPVDISSSTADTTSTAASIATTSLTTTTSATTTTASGFSKSNANIHKIRSNGSYRPASTHVKRNSGLR